MKRIVVDTNVMVSALLFRGETSKLFETWRRAEVRLVLSSEILLEYVRVLAYPKFRLSEQAVSLLVTTHVLPFAETVMVVPGENRCRDPDDDKFLSCAEQSRADALVTGDRDLLALRGKVGALAIITPAEALT
jgi:uncharacterized protein